ncbi:MAG: transcription termination/antitermination protein NusG [Candidatus Roseilinea sp.]|uniref:transcription termination/antitermination protein NusG n=1 Tax=Candidatus Roseilinea sp. TaxID=2838777 RepID=UPI00404ABB05
MIESRLGSDQNDFEAPDLEEVGETASRAYSGTEYIGNEPVKGPFIGAVRATGDLGDESDVGNDQDADHSGSSFTQPQSQEDADAPQWYVVHCYSGYENKVKHNLEQRVESMGMQNDILQVVVPTEEEMEVRDGKRRTVEKRVFPGYILVKMKLNERVLNVVRATPGVTRFVGMGNKPTPLTEHEVNQIMRRMEAEAPKLRVSFRTGQKVRITDGPFADFMGLVDKIDTERAKVTVLVSFFGRETPVELDFLQVERM